MTRYQYIEELIHELKENDTIVTATINIEQAVQVSDYTYYIWEIG